MISSSWLHLKSDVIIRVFLSCWNKTKSSLWWKYEQANEFILNVEVFLDNTEKFNYIFVWAPYSYSSFLLPLIQNVNQNACPWYVCWQDLVCFKTPPVKCVFLANKTVSIQLHSHMELVNQMPMNNKLWKYNKHLQHLHFQPSMQNTWLWSIQLNNMIMPLKWVFMKITERKNKGKSKKPFCHYNLNWHIWLHIKAHLLATSLPATMDVQDKKLFIFILLCYLVAPFRNVINIINKFLKIR